MKQHQNNKHLLMYTISSIAIVAAIMVVPVYATHFWSWAVPPWTTRQSLPQYGCSADGKTCAFAESSGSNNIYAKATASNEQKIATVRNNHSISPNSVGLTPQVTITVTTPTLFEVDVSGSGFHTEPFGSTAKLQYGIQVWRLSGGSYVLDGAAGFATKSGNGAQNIPSNTEIKKERTSLAAGTYRVGAEIVATAANSFLGGTTITDWSTGGYGINVLELDICHDTSNTIVNGCDGQP